VKPSTRKMMAFLTAIFVVGSVLNFAGGTQQAYGIDLGSVVGDALKIGGIAFVVSRFGGQINDGINSIMAQNGVMPDAKTKVVPIIRMGSGDSTAVGAAQVVGPPSQVDKVQAVGEGVLRIGSVQGRLLIPLSTKRAVTDNIRGVGGVGVSANIKIII